MSASQSRRRWSWGLVSLMGACATARPPPASVRAEVKALEARGDVLGALSALQAASGHGDVWADQTHAAYLAFAGDAEGALDAFGRAAGVDPAPDLSEVAAQASPEAPEAALCLAAQSHRLVFINESHHVPSHRALGRRVLRCFREAGFTHLAVEDLREPAAALMARGRVRRDSGFYARDPQLAGLLEDAMRLGFVLVDYEAPPNPKLAATSAARVEERDRIQAERLYSATFAQEPGAKVLGWVGYDHLLVQPLDSDPAGWSMATHLWKRSGVRPYSVWQLAPQAGTPRPLWVPLPEQVTPAFAALPFDLRRSQVDAVVVHPRPAAGAPRRAWLGDGPGFSLQLRGASSEVLVQLFAPDDDVARVVALDQVLCRTTCELVLAKGRFRVRVLTPQGVALDEVRDLGGGEVLTLP